MKGFQDSRFFGPAEQSYRGSWGNQALLLKQYSFAWNATESGKRERVEDRDPQRLCRLS